MSVYHDGVEDMLAEERDAERELAAERLERLERLDGYVPASGIFYGADVIARASTTSPAVSAGVAAGDKSRRVSSTDDEFTPTTLNPAEASSKGHASQRGQGLTKDEAA